ncbi:MAG: hypothetical protein JW874_14555 [Spirochaetales bacterium]|nr:hypothetical protein [Spirochaetales bacterium]
MEQKKILSSLFLLSIALITFELYVIKTFSIGNWSNFGSLVISTALLGFGISGTLLTFLQKNIKKAPVSWLYYTSLGFMVSMALSHIVAQVIPFNPIHIGSNSLSLLYIGLYYVLYGVPFFCGALFIGVSFIILEKSIYRLYFWNMLGSGLGGLLLIILMYMLPPASLIMPIILIAYAANFIIGSDKKSGSAIISLPRFSISTASLLLAVVLVFLFGNIRVSEYKSISYVRNFPDKQEVHHSFSPAGEFHVYASPSLHFAPGLSDNAAALKEIPNQPFWGLYIDGNGPIGIMGEMEKEAAVYMDYLPMAAPYEILQKPKNLLVNLGGGINAQIARYKGASEITIFEQNPAIVNLLEKDMIVSEFTGHLLKDNLIHVAVGETRAHCKENKSYYDLVEISLIDSIGLTDTGGYPIVENFTYTKEAINDYMSALNDNGILSITVWNRINPPRNIPKLISTVVASLREQGYAHPENQIFMFDLLSSTATILVKKSEYTMSEVYDLQRFCNKRSFDIIYFGFSENSVPEGLEGKVPQLEPRNVRIDDILNTYREHFKYNRELASNLKFTNSDLYNLMLVELLKGNDKKLYDDYVFDIRPMTDSRPYYSGYLKLNKIGMYLDQMRDVSEEWAYILIFGILLQAIFFGLLIILIPITTRWRDLFKRQRGIARIIVYYSCLGLGYMFIEIFLIQRLVFFLSNPIFSTSIVITSMLIISGVGNLTSQFIFRNNRAWRVRIAVIGIVLSILFYIFLMSPILNALRSAIMLVRIMISILLVAPAAFFMGMPFPNGLSTLIENREQLLPWAWGMNGGLSVAGTALAQLISVSSGFTLLLVIAMAVYIIVGITFTANEIS